MRHFYFFVFAVALQFTFKISAQSPDESFNGTGFITGTTYFGGINEIEDPADILYEEATGKLIMLNQFAGDGSTLHRFKSDGSADLTFGEEGVQEYPFVYAEYFINVLQNGDGYMLTGRTSIEYNTYYPFLKKINADGTINTSFYEDGMNTIYAIDSFIVTASCKENSGRYYLAGYNVDWDFPCAIIAYNADGSFDSDFGYRTLEGFTYSYIRSIIELSDGRILVSGEVQYPGLLYSYGMIACLHADGTMDETFGEDGYLFPEPDFEHNQFTIEEVVQSADGNIYGSGFVAYPSATGAKQMIIRFDDSGNLLNDFGDDGYYYIEDIIASYPVRLVTDASNDLYLMEVNHPLTDAIYQTRIHKIMPTGEPDLSFTNGVPGEYLIAIPGIESYYEIIGKQMIIQPDGKLVVVGKTDGVSANDDYWIARITTNEEPVDAVEETAFENIISVYPNPASDIIHIQSDVMLESADIISADGSVLQRHSVNSTETNLNVKELPSGFYLINMKTDTGIVSSKYFTKQ